MNDKMNLREWLSFHEDTKEIRSMFLQMDTKMKYIHGRGYYIMNFAPDQIEVDSNGVNFTQMGTMQNDDYKALMDHNIYMLSFLAIASYSQCLDYLKPAFLSEHFDEFVPFLPSDDVAYYKGVIQDKKYFYLNDYVTMKNEMDQSALSDINDGQRNHLSTRTYTKTTPVGKMYTEHEDGLNNSAFVSTLVLSFFVIGITLVTLLGIILFAMK